MSAPLLLIQSVIYLGVFISLLTEGKILWAIVMLNYALANAAMALAMDTTLMNYLRTLTNGVT